MRTQPNSPLPLAPGERIRARPWGFLAIGLALGAGAGFLLRYKGLRKALAVYWAVRRVV